MTDLLLFKHDHSTDATLSVDQLLALPNPFDLVVAMPDDHVWSTAELTDPWFRIISWPALAWPLPAVAQRFTVEQSPESTKASVKVRFRQSFLNLNHASIPAVIKTWWADDTRARPILIIGVDTPALVPATVIAAIGVDRAAVLR